MMTDCNSCAHSVSFAGDVHRSRSGSASGQLDALFDKCNQFVLKSLGVQDSSLTLDTCPQAVEGSPDFQSGLGVGIPVDVGCPILNSELEGIVSNGGTRPETSEWRTQSKAAIEDM